MHSTINLESSHTQNSNFSFCHIRTTHADGLYCQTLWSLSKLISPSGDKNDQKNYTANRWRPSSLRGSLQCALVCTAPRSAAGKCQRPAVALCQHDPSPPGQSARLHALTCRRHKHLPSTPQPEMAFQWQKKHFIYINNYDGTISA